MARKRRRNDASRRSRARYARRWHHRRCRLGHRLPAANPHPLFLHLADGRFGLYVACRLHYGQVDAPNGTARKIVHPAHYGLRLQRACRDGHAHHRKPPVTPDYDDDSAVYVVFGSTTYLYYDYGHVFRRPIPLAGDDFALRHRHSDVGRGQSHFLAVRHQGRGHAVRDGTAALPYADGEGDWPPYVGKRQGIPEKNGWHHPRGIDYCLVARLFRHDGHCTLD